MAHRPTRQGKGQGAIPEQPRGAPSDRPTLGDEARTLARTRIVQGAAIALAARGLDTTVDQVAELAGVSRRTVFRHFATQSDVLAAGVAEIGHVIDARMPGPPSPGADVKTWLRQYATSLHELLRQVIGRAFWDIHIGRPDVTPELTRAMAELTARRRQYTSRERSASTWQSLGGNGSVALWVIDAFAIQCSAFCNQCHGRIRHG